MELSNIISVKSNKSLTICKHFTRSNKEISDFQNLRSVTEDQEQKINNRILEVQDLLLNNLQISNFIK